MAKVEITQTTDSRVLLSWTLYSIFLLARIVGGPFLPGYVHPDELFQSGQELWFGYPPRIPWEFEPHNALRPSSRAIELVAASLLYAARGPHRSLGRRSLDGPSILLWSYIRAGG
jgi:hypothetical protein